MAQDTARTQKSTTSGDILDAAEVIFADHGFHGATTRAIAQQAGANSALIHYYFGSKDALFRAVVARRAGAINAERRDMLAAYHAKGQPSLEDILNALLRPTVSLGRDPSRGGAHYAKLLAHVAASDDPRSRAMSSEHYDDIARIFIAEIEAAVEGLTPVEAVRGYFDAVSIAIALMAPNGRALSLSDGILGEDDFERTMERAVRFISAGIRALADP